MCRFHDLLKILVVTIKLAKEKKKNLWTLLYQQKNKLKDTQKFNKIIKIMGSDNSELAIRSDN